MSNVQNENDDLSNDNNGTIEFPSQNTMGEELSYGNDAIQEKPTSMVSNVQNESEDLSNDNNGTIEFPSQNTMGEELSSSNDTIQEKPTSIVSNVQNESDDLSNDNNGSIEFPNQNTMGEELPSSNYVIQGQNADLRERSEIPAAKLVRRKTISIRRSSAGDEILTFVDENESDIQLPKVKLKSTGLLNCFRTREEEEVHVPREINRDYLDKVLFKEGYNLRGEPLHDLLVNSLSQNILEYMFLALTYTIDNYFGIPGPTSDAPHKLSAILRQIIPLSNDVKQKLLQKLTKARSPPYVLTLGVIEASDLIATDANGLSDPFCKIYLNDEKDEAEKTEVRELTLNPVWNETFRFHLKDFRNDVVKIEIWDSDPIGIAANLEQIRQVNSVRGCWFFCQDFFESLLACGRGSIDDFIGQNELEVGKLYSEGIDKWLPLKTEKGKDQQGKLHVLAKVEVIRPKNTSAALKRHFLLVKLCLDYGVKSTEDSKLRISKWQQILNQSSLTLLFQHAVQGSIYVFEDLVCKFVVVVHLAGRGVAFDFQFIFAISTEAKESLDQSQSLDYFFDSPIHEIYQETTLQLQEICQNVVKELHTYNISQNAEMRIEVEFVLRCINLCQNITGSSSNLWPILKADAEVWFEEQATEIRNLTPENGAENIIRFLKLLKRHLMALDRVIRKVFPETSYTYVTYKSLESSLCEPLKLQVAGIADESLNSANDTRTKKKEEAVQLFGMLKEVSVYLSKTLAIPSSALELGQFHTWFGTDTIKDWFTWKEEVVISGIQFIAEEDILENKMIEVGDRYDKQSLSAKKASDLIQKELCGLWNLVSAFADCKFFFSNSLHNCCMKYTHALLELIDTRNLADTLLMGGWKQLCVIVNNIWSMAIFSATTLSTTAVKLHPNQPCTKKNLQMICSILCRDLSDEVKDDVLSRIRKVAAADTRLKQEDALRDYMWYMRKVYRTEANRDMCLEVYILFQSFVWIHVVKEVEVLKEQNKKPDDTCMHWIRWYWGSSCSKLEGLQKLLRETERLNYYDQNGKLRSEKWNEDFKTLKTDLDQLVELNR